MNFRQWCRSVPIFIVLCGRLANAATESGVTSTDNISPTNGEPFSSATPAPGGTAALDSATVGTAEAVTLDSVITTLSVSEAPTVVSEAPSATTAQPVLTSQGNLLLPLDIYHVIGSGLLN